MEAKLGFEEYRETNKKVQDYLNQCKKENREIESDKIVDLVINSIIIKLKA